MIIKYLKVKVKQQRFIRTSFAENRSAHLQSQEVQNILNHMVALRAAGLVQLREGSQKVYNLRQDTIAAIGPLLLKYLEELPT